MGELDESFTTEVDPFHHDFSRAEDPWAHLQRYHVDAGESERRAQEAKARELRERRKRKRRARRRREKRERREREEAEARQREVQIRMQRHFENATTTASSFMESTRVIDNHDDGAPADATSLMMVKTELLAAVERLGRILPPNTLDQLIDELGGPSSVGKPFAWQAY